MTKEIELLAPAGCAENLEFALKYGADAVYLAGKRFGLRAFSDNFDADGLKAAVNRVHFAGKKVYVTLNIYAYEEDFGELTDFTRYLREIGTDAVLISDPGVLTVVKRAAPDLALHLSTQANTTNSYAAGFWAEQGVRRIVLARELSLDRIRKIRDRLPPEIELEAFVHGAMCVSYSGRCLLSDFTTGRPSNHGECAQSCRWEYYLKEKTREEPFTVQQDARGTYLLNSRDLNMLPYLDRLYDAGVTAFKIEGRMKSAYYVAGIVGAYRRAVDLLLGRPEAYRPPQWLIDEPEKISHRQYCTGFYFGPASQCTDSGKARQNYEPVAVVLGESTRVKGYVLEQRNRFFSGEELEILTPGDYLNETLTVPLLSDDDGNEVRDALRVQQRLHLKTDRRLSVGDVLRRKLPQKA